MRGWDVFDGPSTWCYGPRCWDSVGSDCWFRGAVVLGGAPWRPTVPADRHRWPGVRWADCRRSPCPPFPTKPLAQVPTHQRGSKLQRGVLLAWGSMEELIASRWVCAASGRQSFHCPFCGGLREGEVRTLSRWLAVLGLPVLLLGRVGPFLFCPSCRRTYRRTAELERIERPGVSGTSGAPGGAGSGRVLSLDERAILSVVGAVIFSDSSVRPVEKRAARAVIFRYTGRDLDAAALALLLRTSRERWGDPVRRLRRVACLLDESAKRRIVSAAYLISGSDRELHPEEGRLLMRIGEALELPPRAMRAAMAEARET